MGLIRAALSAATGNLADQWKEFFYCDSLSRDVLMTKGTKRVSGLSSNRYGNDNIITNGSAIAVADGQCMIIVDQGKIVELCAEPGEYIFDQSSEPTIFVGDLKKSVLASLDNMIKRFTFGGEPAHDQRVYYFNTKEIIDNKFGTPNPVPFRIVDQSLNLDLDVSVRCAGVYSYRITDPVLFYMNVCGNVPREYRRDEIDTQLKAEFISALQPCFGKLSAQGIRPNELVNHIDELSETMNETLSSKWTETRGLDVISVAISTISIPEADQEAIKALQRAAALKDPTMAAATLASAQAEAMKAAAANENGAAMGFMGMGMAMNVGGSSPQDLYKMGQKAGEAAGAEQVQYQAPTGPANFCPNCGQKLDGAKFCPNCGRPTGN
ncbi:MAG: SPFH domain-containing protein [Firmicutes bacterium]|nr:SPFH domain-containing protein [Bacillota bacterium]